MSNTYTWIISRLECLPQHDGFNDVVLNIHWRRKADNGAGYTSETYGMETLALNSDAPFTPFDQLTEAQVIGWLEEVFGTEMLTAQEAALDQQIEDQINPPVVRPPLPWSN